MRFGQIDLADVAGDDRFGTKTDACQKHLHLLGRGVLGLIQNDESVVQRAPAHESQRCDFDGLALEGLLNLLKAHQVVQGVVKRSQVGVNFLVQIARQKAKPLARFHSRSRQHNALHGAALQGVYRAGHREIGFASACRANAESDVVAGNVVQVVGLVQRAGFQVAALGLEQGRTAVVHVAVASQHHLDHSLVDRARSDFVQCLQQFHATLGCQLGAVDLELLVPVGDFDL